jgi:predicted secreted protein
MFFYPILDIEENSMVLRKTLLLAVCILLMALSPLWAGDAASFVDLGFSPDGKIYMFAQYGVQSGTLRPWADLFVVDVPRNNFVSGGRISYTHDSPVLAGQDGSGALYRIIARNAAVAEQYGVSFLRQGQPLYIALDNDPPPSGENIEFRDFESGNSYRANLVPYVEGSGEDLKSSFYINLEKTSRDGVRGTYTVGTPQIKRPLIAAYRIKKVMIAPHDGSIVFVIEMKRQIAGGYDIRYMIEAARL